MRGRRPLMLVAMVAAGMAVGCQGMGPSRRIAKAEPPLVDAPGGTQVVEAPPARPVTFADRHPLFTKPREYYESSGSNKVVKAAAATVIGIPAGLFGEVRQIVRGQPRGEQAY